VRAWVHALCILGGIAAPVALTFWSVSDAGPRSHAHYAEVTEKSLGPKDVVLAFEDLGIQRRKPAEAVRRYFSPDLIDHDPDAVGDRQSVIDRLSNHNGVKIGPTSTIKHIVAEDDIVMVHRHLVREPGAVGVAAVDIFRVKDGKVVEHWGVLQPIPKNSPNKLGPF
jgi:predicted SnoaL-like aldol condensation-catalyzing enzyme